MKLRASVKILIGFAALSAGAYYGREFWAARAVDGLEFAPIAPGVVNLVAVERASGFRIIVANQMAYLAQAQSQGFEAPDAGEDTGEVTRKRLPLREMLQAMNGDADAMGRFVSALNEIDRDVIDPRAPVWTAEDMRKALRGEAPDLVPKLEADLNVRLDGTPLPYLRRRALEAGIVIEYPVEIDAPVAPGGKVVARIREPYLPKLLADVEQRVKQKFDLTPEMLKGYYLEEATKHLEDQRERENVRRSLEQRIGEARAVQLAELPERVLAHTTVVVSDRLMERASYSRQEGALSKPAYDLSLELADEGRKRLWQYSRRKKGFQLLLVADGIAIAAPRIDHELSDRHVTIRNMPDEGLVRDAVEMLNKTKSGGTQS